MKLNIFIGLPHYRGDTKTRCSISLMLAASALTSRGIAFSIAPIDNGDVATARNHLASYVVNNAEFSHLMMVDWDNTFQPSAMTKMLDADKDFVACASPFRDGQKFNLTFLGPGPHRAVGGLLRVLRIGGGICLITRKCLTSIKDHCDIRVDDDREYRFNGDAGPLYGFFDRIRIGKRIISEDFSFCDRWRECGGEVYAVVDEQIGHMTQSMQKGRFSDFADTSQPKS